MTRKSIDLAQAVRIAASISWLTMKVLAILYLSRGDIQSFLYQNF